MKIGVFLGGITPEAGGGYTFHSDLLHALSECSNKCSHEFFLLTEHPDQYANIPNLVSLRFHAGVWTQRLFSFCHRITWLSRIIPRQYPWEETLIKNGIEFVWFISNGFVPLDLPNMVVVWDLAHRATPWFPEIGAEGEWEDRERSFSKRLRCASYILTGTQVGKAEIQQYYGLPTHRIRVLPLPTPEYVLNQLKPVASDEARLLEWGIKKRGYLFYPAQLWAHKNHIGLLEAIKILDKKEDQALHIVFTGSDKGNQQYIWEKAEQLGLSGRVHHLGFVTQDDLVTLYRNALALTFVTYVGPDNIPPLEAFALGCPVIASRVSGVEEQLGDAALIVNPSDRIEIANAIKSIMTDSSLRERLIQAGLSRASKWTSRDYILEVFKLFDEFEPVRQCWR